MSFQLTYATMFNPPEELHERFEKALATMRGRLGVTHPLYIDGKDVPAAATDERAQPDRQPDPDRALSRTRTRRKSTRHSQPRTAHSRAGAKPAWRSASR